MRARVIRVSGAAAISSPGCAGTTKHSPSQRHSRRLRGRRQGDEFEDLDVVVDRLRRPVPFPVNGERIAIVADKLVSTLHVGQPAIQRIALAFFGRGAKQRTTQGPRRRDALPMRRFPAGVPRRIDPLIAQIQRRPAPFVSAGGKVRFHVGLQADQLAVMGQIEPEPTGEFPRPQRGARFVGLRQGYHCIRAVMPRPISVQKVMAA